MAVSVALASNALITADQYRDYYGGTSQSNYNQLHFAINAMSDFIERFCHRKFIAAKYWWEEHYGSSIRLKHYPLIHIFEHTAGYAVDRLSGTATGGSTTTLIDTANLTQADDYWNGAEIAVETSSGVWERTTIVDFVASTDTATLSPALSATASGKSYTITFKNPDGYYDLTETDYLEIDHDAGIIKLASGWGKTIITYQGGYTTIPEDLRQATILLVNESMQPDKNVNSVLRDIQRREQELPAIGIANALVVLEKFRVARVE